MQKRLTQLEETGRGMISIGSKRAMEIRGEWLRTANAVVQDNHRDSTLPMARHVVDAI